MVNVSPKGREVGHNGVEPWGGPGSIWLKHRDEREHRSEPRQVGEGGSSAYAKNLGLYVRETPNGFKKDPMRDGTPLLQKSCLYYHNTLKAPHFKPHQSLLHPLRTRTHDFKIQWHKISMYHHPHHCHIFRISYRPYVNTACYPLILLTNYCDDLGRQLRKRD